MIVLPVEQQKQRLTLEKSEDIITDDILYDSTDAIIPAGDFLFSYEMKKPMNFKALMALKILKGDVFDKELDRSYVSHRGITYYTRKCGIGKKPKREEFLNLLLQLGYAKEMEYGIMFTPCGNDFVRMNPADAQWCVNNLSEPVIRIMLYLLKKWNMHQWQKNNSHKKVEKYRFSLTSLGYDALGYMRPKKDKNGKDTRNGSAHNIDRVKACLQILEDYGIITLGKTVIKTPYTGATTIYHVLEYMNPNISNNYTTEMESFQPTVENPTVNTFDNYKDKKAKEEDEIAEIETDEAAAKQPIFGKRRINGQEIETYKYQGKYYYRAHIETDDSRNTINEVCDAYAEKIGEHPQIASKGGIYLGIRVSDKQAAFFGDGNKRRFAFYFYFPEKKGEKVVEKDYDTIFNNACDDYTAFIEVPDYYDHRMEGSIYKVGAFMPEEV